MHEGQYTGSEIDAKLATIDTTDVALSALIARIEALENLLDGKTIMTVEEETTTEE